MVEINSTVRDIAARLGVSKTSVTRAAQTLGITAQMVGNKYVYTAEEDAAITATILKQSPQTAQTPQNNIANEAIVATDATTKLLQMQVEMQQAQITQLQQQVETQQAQIMHLQSQLEAKDKQLDNKDMLLAALQGTVDGLNQSLQASQTLQAATIAALPQRSSIWDKFRRKRKPKDEEDEG